VGAGRRRRAARSRAAPRRGAAADDGRLAFRVTDGEPAATVASQQGSAADAAAEQRG
jgi:hypothetical protein